MPFLISPTDGVPRGTGFCISTNQFLKLIEGLFLEPVSGRSSRRDYVLKELEMGKQGLEKVSLSDFFHFTLHFTALKK